jgi:hypothetical protein
VRNKRVADIGSHHHFIVAKFKMKIQAYKRRTEQLRKRCDVSKLKDDANVRESFKTELKNRFQALTDMENVESETIEENWRKIQTAFTEASDRVLGFKKKIKKDWMTQQTLEKIREWKNVKEAMNACKTRTRKVELQNKYAEKNREVKKSLRRDQRNWTDNLSYQAEEAANKENLKELYAITRILSRKQIKRN